MGVLELLYLSSVFISWYSKKKKILLWYIYRKRKKKSDIRETEIWNIKSWAGWDWTSLIWKNILLVYSALYSESCKLDTCYSCCARTHVIYIQPRAFPPADVRGRPFSRAPPAFKMKRFLPALCVASWSCEITCRPISAKPNRAALLALINVRCSLTRLLARPDRAARPPRCRCCRCARSGR